MALSCVQHHEGPLNWDASSTGRQADRQTGKGRQRRRTRKTMMRKKNQRGPPSLPFQTTLKNKSSRSSSSRSRSSSPIKRDGGFGGGGGGVASFRHDHIVSPFSSFPDAWAMATTRIPPKHMSPPPSPHVSLPPPLQQDQRPSLSTTHQRQ